MVLVLNLVVWLFESITQLGPAVASYAGNLGFVFLLAPILFQLGLFIFGFFCGVVALRQIKKSKEKGKAFAIVAVILGAVVPVSALFIAWKSTHLL
ncbi:MAG: hypothetical protein Q7S89_00055 [bacterium]|nr:hypothetical protein [bacterium]